MVSACLQSYAGACDFVIHPVEACLFVFAFVFERVCVRACAMRVRLRVRMRVSCVCE